MINPAGGKDNQFPAPGRDHSLLSRRGPGLQFPAPPGAPSPLFLETSPDPPIDWPP
jgi:hypothetical protein